MPLTKVAEEKKENIVSDLCATHACALVRFRGTMSSLHEFFVVVVAIPFFFQLTTRIHTRLSSTSATTTTNNEIQCSFAVINSR